MSPVCRIFFIEMFPSSFDKKKSDLDQPTYEPNLWTRIMDPTCSLDVFTRLMDLTCGADLLSCKEKDLFQIGHVDQPGVGGV